MPPASGHTPPLQAEHVASISHAWYVGVRYAVKFCEMRLEIFPEPDKSSFVSLLIAVVGGTENGDAFTVMLFDVSLVLDLMGPHHQLQIVGFQEALGVVWAEGEAHTTLAGGPLVDDEILRHDALV